MRGMTIISETTGTQLILMTLAFVFSAIIGLERRRRGKNAGLRTHSLVGVGSAVFTLVSAYGFEGILPAGSAALDPSRVAAQVVSGIGFLGAGVIFVRKNAVSGLTTAASIWVTAAIGMACGAGMPILAGATVLLHLVIVWALSVVGRWVRPSEVTQVVRLRYRRNRGGLRSVLSAAAGQGYETALIDSREVARKKKVPRVEVTLRFTGGPGSGDDLVRRLAELEDVVRVQPVLEDDE